MKKSLLLLTIVLVLASIFAFTACSNTPIQLILDTPWQDKTETAVYNVSFKDGDKEDSPIKNGEMTMIYESLDEVSFDVLDKYITPNAPANILKPSYKVDKFFGFAITTNLNIDGQSKYSVVITDKKLQVLYSYSKSRFASDKYEDGYEDLEYQITYGQLSCKYEVKGDIDKTNTLKYKEFKQFAYMDNAMYIALTRTMPFRSQFGFVTPSFKEDKMVNRTATRAAGSIAIVPEESIGVNNFKFDKDAKDKTKVPCYVDEIASVGTKLSRGASIKYYVSAIPYIDKNKKEINNVLLEFNEHNVTYKLKSIDVKNNTNN